MGDQGLNGTKFVDIRNMEVGRTVQDYDGYKRGLHVTVDVCMEILTSRKEYETIDHSTVARPLDFAMSTGLWTRTPHGLYMVGCGQDRDSLAHLATYAPGFSRDQARDLSTLWERYHLNSMKAGCAHVVPVKEKDSSGREVASLQKTPPCPFTGYRYGHAWLLEELPAGFVQRLAELLPEAGRQAVEAALAAEQDQVS